MRSSIYLLAIAGSAFLLFSTFPVSLILAQDSFQASEIFYTVANSGSSGGIFPQGDLEPATFGDGDVDGADLAAFSNFLAPPLAPRGDLNKDGSLNDEDTVLFSQQFGIF